MDWKHRHMINRKDWGTAKRSQGGGCDAPIVYQKGDKTAMSIQSFVKHVETAN